MNARDHTPRFHRSSHLVALIAEVERLAATVASADEASRAELAGARLDEAGLATLQLDGSPLTEVPPPPPATLPGDPGPTAAATPARARSGTWLDAMAVDRGEHDDVLLALEFAGARRALVADDLADGLLTEPVAALTELHRRLTAGLLAAEHQGQPRRTEQAVHDASIGRVLYFTPDPGVVPGRLALLAGWHAPPRGSCCAPAASTPTGWPHPNWHWSATPSVTTRRSPAPSGDET